MILLLSWVNYEPYKVDDYTYPPYANGIGWAIAMLIIIVVPIGFVYNVVLEQKGGIRQVSNRRWKITFLSSIRSQAAL